MKNVLTRAAALLSAATSLLTPLHAGAAPKPNLIFIYTDDQRWDAAGVVQREQGERARFPWFKSPGMDRLAAEGVRFRNAFVTLLHCSPSRAAFLTGRYNHLNGVINNNTPFPEDSVTHATLLRAAGYRTAYFGKWHMGGQRGQRQGFDHSVSFVGQGIFNDCPFEINGVSTPTKGWVDDVSTSLAIDWIKQNHDRPFSLVLGFKSPHSPRGGNNLPERLRNLYAGEQSRPTPNLGVPPIYRKPDPAGGKPSQGLADNAIHLDYLRHIKGVDEMVLNIDLAPTFLDLAGVPVPPAMQGASWKELAAGRKPANWRQSFLAEYFVELGDAPTMVGVRTADAKLIQYPGHPEWTEVYDLTADPYEVKNLATDTGLKARLTKELNSQMKAMNYTGTPAANQARGRRNRTNKPSPKISNC